MAVELCAETRISDDGVHHHHEYYFDDGNVIFRAENTLFKVHRIFFQRYSSFFQALFSLPPVEGASAEGIVDQKPILLSQVAAEDFEAFLWLLYPPSFGVYEAPVLQWCSILSLATRWEFDSIRTLALKQLNTFPESAIPPADRLVLARRLQLPEWVLPPLVELVCRQSTITIEEARKLTLEDIVILAKAREEIRKSEETNDRAHQIYYGVRGITPWNERQSVWDAVAGIFGIATAPVHRLGSIGLRTSTSSTMQIQ